MIFYNDNLRTKTSFIHPIEFGGGLLETRKLYSFTEFENNKANELIFTSKMQINYEYDTLNQLSVYELYKLGQNTAEVKADINFAKVEKANHYVFESKKANASWSIGTYEQISENTWKLTFSRVDTFLGYNIYFEEIHQDGLVIQTTKFKWNYAFKKWEKILVLTHEYQFRQTDLERAVKIIKSQGWDTNLINEMLEKYKK